MNKILFVLALSIVFVQINQANDALTQIETKKFSSTNALSTTPTK